MRDHLQALMESTHIRIPVDDHRPIAVVGAGAIVESAHLPAYAMHNLPVVGIFDLDVGRAKDVAERTGLPRVYGSLEELLADEEVEVVDVGVIPQAQSKIARAALDAGKHLLCQKPLAPTVEEATELVGLAAERHRKLAVNQQLRFDEGILAARSILSQGWIGTPTAVSVSVNITTDFTAWGWLTESPSLDLMYHSIHYFDAIRSLVGDPDTVFCTTSRTPGQAPVGETRNISTLVYPGDLRAVVHVNHENRTDDVRAEFRIDGTEGALRGTFGLVYDYPHGRPDTLEFCSLSLPTDGWVPYPVTARWIPDAFAGPMGSLLHAITTDGVPATDGRDNLVTLQLVEALYRSAETSEAVQLGKGASG